MNDLNKKNFLENEKASSYNSYNVNSFRVVSNHNYDKNKIEKEKIISPRMILQSIEKSDREGDSKNKQLGMKPRLLTGKLPSAFDVKYKR